MNIFKRFITVICLTAFLICLSGIVKAKADAINSAEIISNVVQGADISSIAYAYNNLSSQQKYIANYLMGAYNYAYLCARGFSFNIDQTETNMKAQLGSIGERIWQYLTDEFAWRSRFNEVFRQYASSIILYSSKITDTFSEWIDEILAGTRNVYIEYSEDALDAWTVFYNDPSGDGIASFGETISDWNSGQYSDYNYIGRPFFNATHENKYNNFILTYNPVLYSNVDVDGNQLLVAGKLPDAMFIQRNAQGYESFCYGFSDFSNFGEFHYALVYLISNKVGCSVDTGYNIQCAKYIANVSPQNNLGDFINTYITRSPFRISNQFPSPVNSIFYDSYPLITHVFLVDDLNTLSNPEEVYNVEDFNIVNPGMADYIISPNGKMLIPGYAPMTDPFADLWDVSVDVDNNQSTEDDFHTGIVNNTVINNYYVDDTDKINVPVEWFDNEYTDQLNYDAQPFFTFVRDCIRSLGDLQFYFYGAIVVGLGGGIIKKFLL